MHEETPHGESSAVYRQTSAEDAGMPVNLSLVMVVTPSAVNRVVVSRIVERAGLKVVACGVEAVQDLLRESRPCVVVAEEGPEERDRMASLRAAEARACSAAGLPLVVALSRPGLLPAEHQNADAVVAMPITADSLAPVVLRLVEQARRLSSS